jgi:hypothetical protein
LSESLWLKNRSRRIHELQLGQESGWTTTRFVVRLDNSDRLAIMVRAPRRRRRGQPSSSPGRRRTSFLLTPSSARAAAGRSKITAPSRGAEVADRAVDEAAEQEQDGRRHHHHDDDDCCRCRGAKRKGHEGGARALAAAARSGSAACGAPITVREPRAAVGPVVPSACTGLARILPGHPAPVA